MAWGKVTVGGVELRETITAPQNGPVLTLPGQEAHPPRTIADVVAAHHNLSDLAETEPVVPVVFTDKADLTGFYRVTGSQSDMVKEHGGALLTAAWQLTLEKVGGDLDVEIESRVPLIARTTTIGSPPSAVFWHAPAVGAGSYFTGATVPAASIQRPSADGPITVYLGIPAGAEPRWTVPAAGYLLGSSRILLDGIRRLGTRTPEHTAWEMNNGLVRITNGAGGLISVAAWDDATDAWVSEEGYAFGVNGTDFTSTPPEVTILRNDPEECVLRLTYPSSPGRVTVDLSLRRGARFVTGVMKRHSAATLAVVHQGAAAAAAATGGLRASTADAAGNRFVMGSTRAVTTGTPAYFTLASATQLDFFLGHEVAGAMAGDLYADLWAQYRGSTGEQARVVLR